MNKAVICVLGMHRSGTSCLAGSLQLMGLQLGDVVESAPHNRKGNREHLTIRGLNDSVLATSGGRWDAPPPGIRWTDDEARRRDAIVRQFDALPGDAWGFKDPRSTLTLPFWEADISDLRLVATYRHPSAVARSLLARDGLPVAEGLRLWQAYNTRLLACLSRRGGPLVSFDVPADDYLRAAREAARRLGIGGREAAPAAAEPFFDERLRHQSGAAEAGHEPLPREIDDLFHQLDDHSRRSLR